MKIAYTLATFLVLPVAALAATVFVPTNFKTIQGAINACSPGDEIIVRPGIYYERIDFLGKNLTVRSEQGPHATVIDGSQQGSVVTFSGGEGANAVLEGFTIRNGTGTLESTSQTYGGGIYVKNQSSPQIRHNRITGNQADYGGGVHVDGASSPNLEYDVVDHNQSPRGGGMACYNGSAPFLRSCVISDNVGTSFGGGMRCYTGGTPTLMNCVIAHNSGPVRGGGICCDGGSDAKLLYCTVADNTASSRGGAVDCYSSAVTFTDCILWGNAPDQIGSAGTGSAVVTFSDVQGGYTGTGNININPAFVNAPAGDYHLTWGSPCVNAGNNLMPPTVDFEDDPRSAHGGSDMGADEFHRHLYYTGNLAPGGTIQCVLVGLPATTPVALFIGGTVWSPPLASAFGPWYLGPPLIGPFLLPPLPASGIMTIPGTLPATFPGPYAIPTQAIIGSQTTNLALIAVP